MEKPLLLLVNIIASVGLGLGISQYVMHWLDRPNTQGSQNTPKITPVAKKEDSGMKVVLQAPLVRDVQANEGQTPTPTPVKSGPTPTGTKTTPTPTEEPRVGNVTPTPSQAPSSKIPTPTLSPSPTVTDKEPTPTEKPKKNLRSVAQTVLENLPNKN